MPVIPDGIIPVYQQSCDQLHGRDGQRPLQCPDRPGGFLPGQLSQQQEAHTACGEHTDVASSPVEQFQPYVAAASQDKKNGFSDPIQRFITPKKYCQKILKKI